MAFTVPEVGGPGAGEALAETLEGLAEFTGAAAGWVGLLGPDGRLTFPAVRGQFPAPWLTYQQGQSPLWGFTVRAEATLLNDLPGHFFPGEAPLLNMLSCGLTRGGAFAGQIVLANKPTGFTSHDAIALQAAAHLVSRRLGQPAVPSPGPGAEALRLALDNVGEGVLLFDRQGTLVLANATWSQWTGFPAASLQGCRPPFPFWVSHRDLVAGQALPRFPGVASTAPEQPPKAMGYLPFRHRNDSIFWCQVESQAREIDGQPYTLAILRRLPGAPAQEPAGRDAEQAVSFQDLLARLPFAVAVTDGHGRVLWANAALRHLVAAPPPGGPNFQDRFTLASAALLEQLFRDPLPVEPGRRGRLFLQPAASQGSPHDLTAHWMALALPQGPGYLFALAEDWSSLWPPDDVAAGWQRDLRLPAADSLALLIRPGGTLELWDERWERLTGVTREQVADVGGAVVLDWLFAGQKDRNLVQEILESGERAGVQATLEMACRSGSRRLLCTFLPVAGGPRLLAGGEALPSHGAGQPADWLLVVSLANLLPGEETAAQRYLRLFLRGLGHLLTNYLTGPIGLAELSLQRTDLPADLAEVLAEIRAGCRRVGPLFALLHDLGLTSPGATHEAALGPLVDEVLRDYFARQAPVKGESDAPGAPYHLEVRSPDPLVRVNLDLFKKALGHLLENAAQATARREPRPLRVRVGASNGEACCEIQDAGDGLPVGDWSALLAPFYSTKGAFAREPAAAQLDATGLGLTISQHLLALHGGRLELHSIPGEGTTAVAWLPRADVPHPAPQGVRADAPEAVPGPHPKSGIEGRVVQ